MHGAGAVGIMLIVWAVLTAVWIVLLIYRSVHMADESEQLFLSQREEPRAREQQEVIHRERRVGAFLYAFGIASIVLLVSIVGVWVWHGLGA